MSTKKLLGFTVFVSILAATFVQIPDQLLTAYVLPAGALGFGWLTFQGWAMYFLSGSTVEGGIKNLLGYTAGLVGAFLIFTVGGLLSGLGFWASPLAILIVNPFVLLLENAGKWFANTAPIFVGAGTYFGFMLYIPGASNLYCFMVVLGYVLLGQVLGYVTVYARGKYEAMVNKETGVSKLAK